MHIAYRLPEKFTLGAVGQVAAVGQFMVKKIVGAGCRHENKDGKDSPRPRMRAVTFASRPRNNLQAAVARSTVSTTSTYSQPP